MSDQQRQKMAVSHFGSGARIIDERIEFNNNGELASVTPVSMIRPNPVTGAKEQFLSLTLSSGDMRTRVEYRVSDQGQVDMASFRLSGDPNTKLPSDHPARLFSDSVTQRLLSSGLVQIRPIDSEIKAAPRPSQLTPDGRLFAPMT